MAAVFISTLALSAVVLISDYKMSRNEAGKIVRNSYGMGDSKVLIEIAANGKKLDKPLEIAVGEKQYTKEEMKKVFEESIRKLKILVPGSNKSLNQVRSNINLLTKIPEQPVEVSWELSRYDVINVYGELQSDALKEHRDGVIVRMKAFLTYTEDPSMEAMHEMAAHLYPPKYTGNEKILADVEEKIEREVKDKPEKETIILPKKINGNNIGYYVPMNYRGLVLLFIGVAVMILLGCMDGQEKRKEADKRKMQMMLDYPEIINKLNLLLGAGMTVKSAWKKIAADYEKNRAHKEKRYAYEEIRAACNEMHSGVPEAECYERFGKRCKQQAYIKLGALLSQNLRKGTRGLAELLKIEAIHAFEERKALAKRQGEEAGTKLLLPMFFMLGIVLVIVIVPAFLSIQL